MDIHFIQTSHSLYLCVEGFKTKIQYMKGEYICKKLSIITRVPYNTLKWAKRYTYKTKITHFSSWSASDNSRLRTLARCARLGSCHSRSCRLYVGLSRLSWKWWNVVLLKLPLNNFENTQYLWWPPDQQRLTSMLLLSAITVKWLIIIISSSTYNMCTVCILFW